MSEDIARINDLMSREKVKLASARMRLEEAELLPNTSREAREAVRVARDDVNTHETNISRMGESIRELETPAPQSLGQLPLREYINSASSRYGGKRKSKKSKKSKRSRRGKKQIKKTKKYKKRSNKKRKINK